MVFENGLTNIRQHLEKYHKYLDLYILFSDTSEHIDNSQAGK